MTVRTRKHDTIIERARVKDRGKIYKSSLPPTSRYFTTFVSKKLDSKSYFHIKEKSYKSHNNCRDSTCPYIVESEIMNKPVGNKENNKK